MNIRLSNRNDINQLIKMRYDFTAEYKEVESNIYESFSEECGLFFDDMYESNRWIVWVAEIEGRIVSHVFIEVIDTIPRPGRKRSPFGYITNVYTIPEYRSQGIGGKIMEEINRCAKENGLTFLMVWPSETSVDFYERHGFERAEEVMENHLKKYVGNAPRTGTSYNNVFTHRRTSRLGPGSKVEEVDAGTHPFTQPHRGRPRSC